MKKISGRKRHVMRDTLGNLLKLMVRAIGIQDYHGVQSLLHRLTEMVISLKTIGIVLRRPMFEGGET